MRLPLLLAPSRSPPLASATLPSLPVLHSAIPGARAPVPSHLPAFPHLLPIPSSLVAHLAIAKVVSFPLHQLSWGQLQEGPPVLRAGLDPHLPSLGLCPLDL